VAITTTFSRFLRIILPGFGFLIFSANYLPAQDRLVIISPHWEGIRYEFETAFRPYYKRLTGRSIELDWRDMGGASDDLRFVLSEFKKNPKGIGIDLFFGGGIDPFQELKGQKVLTSYNPPDALIESLPKNSGYTLYDPDRYWFGAALSSFGILRNDRVIKSMQLPEVKTWKDLANPALKGWVGSGDPRNSGSTHMVYECILQAYGWDEGWNIIRGLGANVRHFDRSAGSTAKQCTLGNVAYALVVDFYGFMQIAEGGSENMSMVIPEKESIVTPDAVAILKGAPNLEAAQAFIDFVVSDRAQALWLAPLGHPEGPKKFRIERMATRPELYEKFGSNSLVKINPFRNLRPIPYNSKKGTLRWSSLNALLGALIIDRPPQQRMNVKIPVSELELDELSSKDWKDPIRRVEFQLKWQNLEVAEKPR
jgi:ABC-type Fe3+ transport system substrate-binding protein